jgi:hypothetical protein
MKLDLNFSVSSEFGKYPVGLEATCLMKVDLNFSVSIEFGKNPVGLKVTC